MIYYMYSIFYIYDIIYIIYMNICIYTFLHISISNIFEYVRAF